MKSIICRIGDMLCEVGCFLMKWSLILAVIIAVVVFFCTASLVPALVFAGCVGVMLSLLLTSIMK